MLYSKDDHEALNWVRQERHGRPPAQPDESGRSQSGRLSGRTDAPKSTYFFPKPLTGLVMNVMEG